MGVIKESFSEHLKIEGWVKAKVFDGGWVLKVSPPLPPKTLIVRLL